MKKPVNIVDKAMEIARSVRRVPKKSAKKKAKKPALVVMDMVQDVEQDIPIANALRLARGGGGGADSGQAANRTSPSRGGGGGGAADSGQVGGGKSGSGVGGSNAGSRAGGSGGAGDSGRVGGGQSGSSAGSRGVQPSAGGGGGGGGADSGKAAKQAEATKAAQTKTSVSPAAREPAGYSRPAGYGAAPSGVYGPRMVGDVVSNAPSTFSTENAMKQIAEGSSIVGGGVPKPTEPKIQDQVPSAPVKLEQTPTISRNAYDAYTPSDADIFAGANSPLAGGGLDSYNRDTYQSLQTPTQQAALNAANQAAADARFVGSDVNAPVPSSGNVSTLTRSAVPAGAPVAPTYVAGDPRVNYAQPAYSNTVSGTPSYLGSDTNYPTVITSNYARPNVGASTLANTTGLAGVNYGNLDQPGYGYTQVKPASSVPDREISSIVAGDLPPLAIGTKPQGYAQTGRVITVAGSGWPVQNIAANVTPVGPQINNVATGYPASSTYVAQSQTLPPSVSNSPQTRTPLPGYDVQTASAEESVGPYDYTEPTNDIYPNGVNELGQTTGGYFTPEQRAAYLSNLGDTRSSERPFPAETKKKPEEVIAQAPVEPYKPVVNPPYVYRDYLSESYGTPLPPPSTSIADFNAYNQRYMKRGGRIGGSLEAALRIAKSKLL